MLELMHFPEELLEADEFKLPAARTVSREESAMARKLVTSMSVPWRPDAYRDEYHEALEKVVEEKLKHPHAAKTRGKRAAKPASNVIDLAAVLRQSLREAHPVARKKSARPKRTSRRLAA